MKILIIEDEIPAYQKLVSYLNEYYENDPYFKGLKNIKGTSLVYLAVE